MNNTYPTLICNILMAFSAVLYTLGTFALVYFGRLQFLEVEKQNKQNLFKVRVEYFMANKKYLTEVFILFEKVINMQEEPVGSISKNNCIFELCEEIELLSNDAMKCSKEIAYIYSKNLANNWSQFFAKINVLSKETYNNPDNPLKSEMVELVKFQKNIIDVFDEILKL